MTDNATLEFSRSDATTFDSAISGTGAVVVDGGTTLTLSNTNTYSGGTTVTDGATLIVSAANGENEVVSLGSGEVTLDGGVLRIATGGASSIDNVVAIGAGGGKMDGDDGGGFLGGGLTGAGQLTLTTASNASLVLGHDDSAFTGMVTIAQGSVELGADNALNATNAVTVTGTGSLDLSGRSAAIGSLSGAGGVTDTDLRGFNTLTVGALGDCGRVDHLGDECDQRPWSGRRPPMACWAARVRSGQ